MADDSHENGTSNGDVPEIELIIKVSLARVQSKDEEGERDRGEKKAIVPCTIWAWNELDWFRPVLSSSSSTVYTLYTYFCWFVPRR